MQLARHGTDHTVAVLQVHGKRAQERPSSALVRRGPIASWRRRVLVAALVQAGLVLLLAATLHAVSVPAAQTKTLAMTVEVDDSSAARSIADDMPDSLTLEDRMGAALIARDIMGADTAALTEPVVEYRVGDVAWSPARGELIVFTSEGSGVGGTVLVHVGTVRSSLMELQDCVRDCRVAVTLDTSGAD